MFDSSVCVGLMVAVRGGLSSQGHLICVHLKEHGNMLEVSCVGLLLYPA